MIVKFYLKTTIIFTLFFFFIIVWAPIVYSIQVLAIPKKVVETIVEDNGSTREIVKEGVMVLYFPQKKVAVDEFRIYRNGNLLTTVKPIQDLKTIEELNKKQYKTFVDYFGVKDIKDLADRILSYDQQFIFIAVYNPDMRKIMGISYDDFSKGSKKRKYKVTSIKSGNVLESGEALQTVEVGKYPYIPPPKEIKLEEGSKTVYFTWKKSQEHEQAGVIGYKIYVSKEKDKNYESIPQGMITGFKSQPTQNQIEQSSNSEQDDTNSKVRRRKRPKEPEQKKTDPNELTQTVSNLENNQRYFFRMKSVNIADMESEFSDVYTALPRDTGVPGKVNITSVEAIGKNSADSVIKWEQLQDAKYLNHYEILRSEDNKQTYKKINSLPIGKNKTKYEDTTDFVFGKEYWYRVVAVNKYGDIGIPSTEISYVPEIKSEYRTIDILKVDRDSRGLKVFFKNLSKDNQNKVSYYVISRKSKIEGGFTTLSSIRNLNRNTYLDKDVQNGTTYCYVILVKRENGDLSKGGREDCNTAKVPVKLDPPISVKSYSDQGGIAVTWNVKQEAFISGFLIFRKSSKEKQFSTITDFPLSSLDRRYIDTNVGEGLEYTYYLKTVSSGNILSRPSEYTTHKKAIRKPSHPKNLKIFQRASKKNTYYLEWKYFDTFDYFIVYMNKIERALGKTIQVRKTKEKKITFTVPQKGNYQIYVVAFRKGIPSINSEKKRFTAN